MKKRKKEKKKIGSITNLLNFLTTIHPMNHTECHIQHALSITRLHTFNQNVVKLFDFVLERQNPYSVTSNVVLPLDNVLTKLAVDTLVAARLRMCLDNGERVYRISTKKGKTLEHNFSSGSIKRSHYIISWNKSSNSATALALRSSHHIVTSRTLRHSLDGLLDLHVTPNST